MQRYRARRRYRHVTASRDWAGAAVARLEPEALSAEWLRTHAFAVPLLLRPRCSDGGDDVAAASAPQGAASLAAAAALGMRLPTLPLRVADVAEGVGVDAPVPTLDVARQADGPRGLTLGAFAAYWDDVAARRKRLLNCVSLSLARTRLGDDVAPPAAVAALDLLADAWPAGDVADADCSDEAPRPEVLLYALMSPAGSYTDWHVDFGGSAVWYHLLSGTKVFLLAPPSAANLAAFEAWAASPAQARTFLGASLAGTQRVELAAGDTLLIPSGWPHAVATPADAIALGGNFLTPLALPTALRVADVEDRLGVEAAARFPAWHALLWRAASRFEARLADGGDEALSAAEKAGVAALAPRLAQWVEDGGEHAAPKAVGDGAALAAALSARVAAWGAASAGADREEAEEAARIAAAAAAGDVGAALTLRGAAAEGADVALLRGGRRGERWAAATLVSYDTAARTFLVVFAPRTGDRPAMLPERLRLHHRTLRVVSAADAAAAEAAAAARQRALSRRAAAAAALNADLARTAHALLPLPDAPLIAVKASTTGPYAALGAELVGAWVWRHWPDDGGWFRARVASYDSASRTWRLLYDAGTAAEAEEIAPLAEMTWRELRLTKPKSGPGAAHAGAAAQDDGSSEESESEEEHAADDVAQRPRPPPLPAHLRVRARRERERARAAAASAAAATSSPPPPAPPPRVTVAGLLRKGLREEASQLAATPSADACAPASAPAASAAAAVASRPLSAPLRRFLSAAGGGETAPEALPWASLMKAVLDYARAKGLRGAGGVVRCDAPLQELLGRATVQAAELAAALRPHFGGSGVAMAHPQQQQQQRQQRQPMLPPPPPRPAWGHAAAPAARPYSPTRAFEGERAAAAKRPRSSPPPPPPRRDDWDDMQEWRPPPQPMPPPPPPQPVFSDDEDDLPEMTLPTWIKQPPPPPPPQQQQQQTPWAGWNGGGAPMPQMQAQTQAPAWLGAPPQQQQQPAAYAMPPAGMAMMYAPPAAMPQQAPYMTWQQGGDMMMQQQQQQQAHPGGFYGPGAGGAYAQQPPAWAQQPPPGAGGPAAQWPPPQPPPPPLPPQWGPAYGGYG